ncbi:MAG: PilN domain-containing protein [Patescibacteria group bacterium]|jgi:Tfp pilus assembly protein PilN
MFVTVNLISPDKKRDLRNALVMAYTQTMVTLLFVTAIIVTGTLISVRLMIKGNYEELQRQSASAASEESTNIMENIHQINVFLKRIESTEAAFIPWADILEQLSPLVPAGVRLETLTVNGNGDIAMSGLAETRDGALILLKNLKEAPFIKNVVSPLSNIMQKQDVRFDFQMKLVNASPVL